MINRRDVVRLRVPFPDISSDLAVNSHMYICREVDGNTVRFLKCQTLKPQMLIRSPIQHFWDEIPDVSRNPFQRKTRIDCDKEFFTAAVAYDDRLKTIVRPDVCEDIMEHAEAELEKDGYNKIHLNESELLLLNNLATLIQ